MAGQHKLLYNATAFTVLCKALNEGEHTQVELQEITGLCNSTMSKWMALLHRNKLIYICEWRRKSVRGSPAKVWTWGWMEVDVIKPAPMCAAEYHRRWKQKQIERKLHGHFSSL